MPLLDHMLTTRDIAIQRAGAYLTGGDRARVTIHRDLRAKVQANNGLVVDGRVRSANITAVLWMRHITEQGEALDLQQGDEISWPDWRGDRQISRIASVTPQYDAFGGRLDHLLVEVEA